MSTLAEARAKALEVLSGAEITEEDEARWERIQAEVINSPARALALHALKVGFILGIPFVAAEDEPGEG